MVLSFLNLSCFGVKQRGIWEEICTLYQNLNLKVIALPVLIQKILIFVVEDCLFY